MASEAVKTHKRTRIGAKGRYFMLTVLFASFTSSVMLSDSFRDYEASVSILVIAKSDTAAATLRDIVANAEHIADSDAFRASFFRAVSERSGVFDGLSESDRRETMEDMVSVRAERKGSLLSVRSFSDDADDAKSNARQAALSLFGTIGQYYDLKKDIDLRIVSGPSVSARIAHPWLFILSSAALGAVVASVFFSLLFRVPDVLSFFERKGRISNGPLDAKVFEPEVPESSFLRDTVETDREAAAAVIAEHEAAPTSAHDTGKKSSAPSNLPSFSEAQERFLREFSFEGSLEREEDAEVKTAAVATGDMRIRTEAEAVPDPSVDEPTAEEYKRRLNELLRG